jgi:hypothetical protein
MADDLKKSLGTKVIIESGITPIKAIELYGES